MAWGTWCATEERAGVERHTLSPDRTWALMRVDECVWPELSQRANDNTEQGPA